MTKENDLQHVKNVLLEHKKGHLLSFWDKLDAQGENPLFSSFDNWICRK